MTIVTEERGTYNVPNEHLDRGAMGIQHIGDVLRRLVDERGWLRPESIPNINGNGLGTNGGSRHGDD